MSVPLKPDWKTTAIECIRGAIPGVIAIYVFGSQASGATHPESDVDLAVLTTAALTPEQRWELRERLADRLRRPVDLVDLRGASTVMQMQVISSNELLYDGDKSARQHFEVYVFSSYARLNEERREILKDIAARGTIYGR